MNEMMINGILNLLNRHFSFANFILKSALLDILMIIIISIVDDNKFYQNVKI
jgi:hypothetical protein